MTVTLEPEPATHNLIFAHQNDQAAISATPKPLIRHSSSI